MIGLKFFQLCFSHFMPPLLKSDYDRIEICLKDIYIREFILLKSDYDRIEIFRLEHGRGFKDPLKSDYDRIEIMLVAGSGELALDHD